MACCSTGDCAARGERDAKPIMQTAHTITLLKNFCMDLLDHLVDTTGQRHSRNERYGISRPTFSDQSGLAPENFTTLPHFSVSSAMSFPKSAGEPGSSEAPSSANRACDLRSARIAFIALLIL